MKLLIMDTSVPPGQSDQIELMKKGQTRANLISKMASSTWVCNFLRGEGIIGIFASSQKSCDNIFFIASRKNSIWTTNVSFEIK